MGFPLAVLYKYIDDSGGYLAALIAYYGFVSFFPLLLLSTTVLGFLLAGDQHLQHQVLTSALRQFPVVGKQLSDPARIGGGSFDAIAGSLDSMFDFGSDDHQSFFDHKNRCDATDFLILDEHTGQPVRPFGR